MPRRPIYRFAAYRHLPPSLVRQAGRFPCVGESAAASLGAAAGCGGALVLLGLGLREVLKDSTQADETLVYYTVRTGTLPIIVTERGNLESQQTEQVICEVENFGGDRTGQTGTQCCSSSPTAVRQERGSAGRTG